jgi:8-oxo-dGTP diphosphatase
MINCFFEDGGKARVGLRHVTVGAIAFNDKNEILLVKRSAKFSRPGKYSVPGGFLDRDQTTREAVLRELKEETGHEGEILSLFHINDSANRPKEDRQNVDFIYLVKVKQGKFLKNDEITSTAWFSKDNLPSEEDFAFDHRAVILRYFEYLRTPFTLPIIGKI